MKNSRRVPAGEFFKLLVALLLPTAIHAEPVIEFTLQPASLAVGQGQAGSFTAEARAADNGAPVAVIYQWQQLSDALIWVNIAGATNSVWAFPPIFDCIPAPKFFRCLAAAGEATASSDEVVLFVVVDCSAPRIVSVEASVQSQEVVVTFDELMDPISATDSFNYSIQERSSQTHLDVGSAIMRTPRSVVLTIDGTSPLRSGMDYVMRASEIRDISDPACGCPPVLELGFPFVTPDVTCARITRQPRNLSVATNCAATFEVAARWDAGAPPRPFRYQWFRGSIPISGATNRSYTTSPVSVADDGAVYHVDIQGACRTLMSSNAQLRVSSDVTYLRLENVTPGPVVNSVIFTYSSPCGSMNGIGHISGADPFNYSWFSESDPIYTSAAYFDCSGLNVIVLTTLQTAGSNYVVTVANVNDNAGYQLEEPQVTREFTAPQRPPVPFGILQTTPFGGQSFLEWAEGGILQFALDPAGQWEDTQDQNQPYAVRPFPAYCEDPVPFSRIFFRVRWPAH